MHLRSYINFVKTILGKIGIKCTRMTLFERLVELSMPIIKAEIPVKIISASSDDIKKLYKKKDDAIRRLEDGDLCFIATLENKLIAHFWVSLKERVCIPEIERSLDFGNGSAYLYNAWVHPSHRNKNIGKKAFEEILHSIKLKGIKKIFSLTGNPAAKKALCSSGFYPIKNVFYLRIFMFKKYEETKLR